MAEFFLFPSPRRRSHVPFPEKKSMKGGKKKLARKRPEDGPSPPVFPRREAAKPTSTGIFSNISIPPRPTPPSLRTCPRKAVHLAEAGAGAAPEPLPRAQQGGRGPGARGAPPPAAPWSPDAEPAASQAGRAPARTGGGPASSAETYGPEIDKPSIFNIHWAGAGARAAPSPRPGAAGSPNGNLPLEPGGIGAGVCVRARGTATRLWVRLSGGVGAGGDPLQPPSLRPGLRSSECGEACAGARRPAWPAEFGPLRTCFTPPHWDGGKARTPNPWLIKAACTDPPAPGRSPGRRADGWGLPLASACGHKPRIRVVNSPVCCPTPGPENCALRSWRCPAGRGKAWDLAAGHSKHLVLAGSSPKLISGYLGARQLLFLFYPKLFLTLLSVVASSSEKYHDW
ncbi:uncharacterized protein [Notamacropus eugenii]|uniref:uncharacterized protein n=1 Tax=Notamacropus eugenii TaxID=9315 RepID=UPI003B684BB2